MRTLHVCHYNSASLWEVWENLRYRGEDEWNEMLMLFLNPIGKEGEVTLKPI